MQVLLVVIEAIGYLIIKSIVASRLEQYLKMVSEHEIGFQNFIASEAEQVWMERGTQNWVAFAIWYLLWKLGNALSFYILSRSLENLPRNDSKWWDHFISSLTIYFRHQFDFDVVQKLEGKL